MSITYLLYVNFGNKDRKNYNKFGIFSYIHTFFLHFLALAHCLALNKLYYPRKS